MYLTIDINTDNTIVCIFESLDKNSRIKMTKYPTIYNYKLALEKLTDTVEKLLARYKSIDMSSISITGLVNNITRIMESSAYLKDYENNDIRKALIPITNTETIIEQDCILNAYAEIDNKGNDLNEFGLITVTYGIGGVFLRKNKSTWEVFPTELGHTIVNPNGAVCPCGQRGCVEAYIGGVNMQSRFLKRPDEIDDLNIWEDAVDYLAIASTNFLMAFPTKNLIYSGSSIESIPILKNKIKEQLEKRMTIYNQPNITISNLGNNSNTIGALKHIELKENNLFFRIH